MIARCFWEDEITPANVVESLGAAPKKVLCLRPYSSVRLGQSRCRLASVVSITRMPQHSGDLFFSAHAAVNTIAFTNVEIASVCKHRVNEMGKERHQAPAKACDIARWP